MDLKDKKSIDSLVFQNPPILKGLETKIDQINIRDRKEKIVNQVMKRNDKIKFSSNSNNVSSDEKLKVFIRPPPNFLI